MELEAIILLAAVWLFAGAAVSGSVSEMSEGGLDAGSTVLLLLFYPWVLTAWASAAATRAVRRRVAPSPDRQARPTPPAN